MSDSYLIGISQAIDALSGKVITKVEYDKEATWVILTSGPRVYVLKTLLFDIVLPFLTFDNAPRVAWDNYKNHRR